MVAFCGVLQAVEGACSGDIGDAVAGMLSAGAIGDSAAGAWQSDAVALGESGTAATQRTPGVRSADDGLAIVAWARLDDREALCDAVGVPANQDDHALLLGAYRRWGTDCPKHLLGDYAFAIWDGRRGRLFCARDHIGVRPLYYAQTSRALVFASSVEAVLAGPGVDQRLDEATAATYLKFVGWGTCTASRTFFRAVRMLPGGHAMVVERGRHRCGTPRIWRYWAPEDAAILGPASDDDYVHAFLDLYQRSVRDRLRGAGPIGVHLSGGLDSSSVAVLANHELRTQGRPSPLAFSWLPPNPEAPGYASAEAALEYGRVEAVAAQESLTVSYQAPTPADFLAAFEADAALPWAHTSVLEYSVQRKAAAGGVRVMLSGWGGDEAVSARGGDHYTRLLLGGRWGEFAALAKARERRSPLRVAPAAVLGGVPNARAVRAAWRRLRGRVRREPGRALKHFVSPALARLARAEFMPGVRSVRQGQASRLRNVKVRPRLEQEVASGVRNGVEYRYPLLDRRILEFALGLPPRMYLRPVDNRFLMRRAAALALGPGERAPLPPQVRWDESKLEPTVWQAYAAAFAAALPAFRERLAERVPTRAGYVDMPRLMEILDADRFMRNPPLEGLSRALLFLDY